MVLLEPGLHQLHSKLNDCTEEDRGAGDVGVLIGVLSSETEGLDAHLLLGYLLAKLLELLDMVQGGEQIMKLVVSSEAMVLFVADEFSHLGPRVGEGDAGWVVGLKDPLGCLIRLTGCVSFNEVFQHVLVVPRKPHVSAHAFELGFQ